MKLNSIEDIDSNGGDYLLLVDYGYEGLSVSSQHETLPDAVNAAMRGNISGPTAIVKLVEVPIEAAQFIDDETS